jgi:hypothetical protein
VLGTLVAAVLGGLGSVRSAEFDWGVICRGGTAAGVFSVDTRLAALRH